MSSKNTTTEQVDISVVDFPECVRIRREMYLDDKNHAVQEIVDNGVDENLAGYCSRIEITIHKDESVTVLDNGRGMPVDKHTDPRYKHLTQAEVAYTVLHAGGKFGGKKKSYKVATGGLHGVGASVVNATSSALTLTIYKDREIYMAEFEKGIIKTPMYLVGKNKDKITGTKVHFMLDNEIWIDEDFDFSKFKERFKQCAYLNPGLTISYTNLITDESYEFFYEEGVKSYVDHMASKKGPIGETVYAKDTQNDVQIQFALCYTNAFSPNIYSFCNNIITSSGGDHLIGTNNGITKAINDFAIERKIIKEDDKFEIADCIEGVSGVISVMVKEPKFEGQGKSKIRMPFIRSIVKDCVFNIFYSYLDHHPKEAKLIIEKIALSKSARTVAQQARENVRKQKSLGSGRAKGIADCSEKDPVKCEIYIVEGDSAGGTAKKARERKTQAILPIFGKVLNVAKKTFEKALDNDKLEDLTKALRCGIGEDFDINKIRYHKIIIMSDADKLMSA